MRNLFNFLLVSFFSFYAVAVQAQTDTRNCKKRIKISGALADGSGQKETIMTVTMRFYDFSPEQKAKQLENDKYRYTGFDYQYMDEPTLKMDCAGNTLKEMFGTGKYWITAEVFYNSLIKPYAKKISNAMTWGDAKSGDVVVFIDTSGKATHISYVNSVITTAGVVTSINILTKESKEATYLHKLTLGGSGNDPLLIMGTPNIYRIDHDNIDVNDAAFPDCKGMQDVIIPPATYTLKQAIADNEHTGFKEKSITETECSVTVDFSDHKKDSYSFRLLNKPPAIITAGSSFPITVSGSCTEARLDYNVWARWRGDDGFSENHASDKNIMVGTNTQTKAFTPNAKTDMNITVPEYYGKQLIFTLRIVYGTGAEPTGYEWVRFVYEKN